MLGYVKAVAKKAVLRIAVILAICGTGVSAQAQGGGGVPGSAARWVGIYVGGHAGMGTADFDSLFDAGEIGTPDDFDDSVLGRFFELDGGLAGVHIGYNQQIGRLIFGVEADWSHFGVSDRLFDPDGEGVGTTDSASAEINWIASLRGRLGFASGQSLIYLTAGVAWVDAKYTASNLDGIPSQGSTDVNGVGIVVGGGLEHAITNQITLRLEGLYYAFRDRVDTRALNSDSDTGDYAKVDDIVVARIGVTYHLTGTPGAPHVPPFAAWSGFYVGGHLGYGESGFDGVFDSSEIGSPGDFEDSVLGRFFDLEGVVGGGHVGFNQQFGRFVLGIEAGWSYLGQSDLLLDPDPEFGPGTDNASVDMNWLASVRGRVGITSARTLLYATAGFAWVNGDYTAQNGDNGNVNQGSTDLNASGFVWGGGLEHALSDNILLRIEGLHYSFDDRKVTSALTTDSDAGDFAKIEDITVVRVGASYRFNFGAN